MQVEPSSRYPVAVPGLDGDPTMFVPAVVPVLAVFVVLIDTLVSHVEHRLLIWRPRARDRRG